ncbi:serine hydrolase domain-containing protein [Algimonas porphyrae]|uniref:Penicillin-binding protein n=1 Tax=Algimonas porphyrae TaxID=1128113 RepID=A0ABQ5V533_9PROT|nr:serine hydrolase domain-containing protein [Algimonas porphyrae]GLQ21824.1 penicillin-binding protein [Algimonas porphyrae]
MRRFFLACLIGLLALPAFAQTVAQTPRQPGLDLRELDRRATQMMQQSQMSGLAMAVVRDGEMIFVRGYGERARGTGLRVDGDTVFRWASVSKSVAAATLLQLVETGAVDPSQPIEELAPSLRLPPTDNRHTVIDLLSHRIGITRNAYDGRIEDGRAAKDLRDEVGDLPYLCAPRTCHTYQNVVYDASAEIVEEVTELPYKTIIQRDIFDPLGMKTASLTREGLVRNRNWAQPHGRRGQRINRLKPGYYRVPGAAGVNSSVRDLARWMTALMPIEPGHAQRDHPDHTLYSTANLTAMMTPIVPTPREQRMLNRNFHALRNSHYGLGLRVYDYHGRKVVGHRGGVEGYRSLILFDPELRTGIAVMWNSPHSQPIGLQLEFLDQLYGLPRRDWLQLSRRRPS